MNMLVMYLFRRDAYIDQYKCIKCIYSERDFLKKKLEDNYPVNITLSKITAPTARPASSPI